jgi:hypothetical protein
VKGKKTIQPKAYPGAKNREKDAKEEDGKGVSGNQTQGSHPRSLIFPPNPA